MRLRRTLLLLALLLPAAAPAAAQFFAFGQNKIQYRRFDWQILRGPHVDLYFYPEEAGLAGAALAYAEASYDSLRLQFGHDVPTRIPLIMYASHADFEQTNILPFTPPEGILGATDFLKRRVTLPFRGSFAEFRHTLRHELVHVFQLSLGTANYYKSPRITKATPPLWWTEGLAEYWSEGEDARDEMVLRDLILSGKLPTLAQLSGPLGGLEYPLGGRIHRWLGETYGDWRVALFYQEQWRYETFEDAMLGVYGRTLDQLNEEFQLAMRRAYYPTVQVRDPLPVKARLVAHRAIKGAFVPGDSAGEGEDGPGEAVYISPVTGYVTIYRKGLAGGRERTVLTGGRSADLESLHPFASRLDASRPGHLLFSARIGDRDALVVWNLDERRVVGRYQFPDLVSILSPAWTPDGRAVLFSGLTLSGISDLYRVTLPDGELTRLTDDPYQDLDPSPSPDGTRLVFVSDRTAGGLDGSKNLFVLDLATGAIRQLTSGTWVDESPTWSADDRIVFASGRDGILNVFSVDTLGAGRRETSAWTGAFDPAVSPDGGALLVSGFNGLSLDLYHYPPDDAARADTFGPPDPDLPPHSQWPWPGATDAEQVLAAGEPYRRRLTLDFAAGEATFLPGIGSLQGASFLMSDLLSDHLVVGTVASYQAEGLGGLLDNLNVGVVYLNQKRRLNWGGGLFRTKGSNFEGSLDVAYEESAVGALGILRYPLDRFNRLEASMVVERSDRVDFTLPVDEPRRVGWIASHFVSYVHDNSLWVPSGPIDGGRLSLTAGLSSDFSNSRFDNFLFAGDLRRYFRLGRRSAYAARLFGFWSGGDRPRRVNLGGTVALRGYPLFGRIVGSRAYMINQELRYPLLNHLTFGTPLGTVRFPEIQGAFFADLGRAWFESGEDRAVLGSYGASFRWPLGPFAVLRLDVGRRFSSDNFRGYGLTPEQRKTGFVSFFFGYNY